MTPDPKSLLHGTPEYHEAIKKYGPIGDPENHKQAAEVLTNPVPKDGFTQPWNDRIRDVQLFGELVGTLEIASLLITDDCASSQIKAVLEKARASMN